MVEPGALSAASCASPSMPRASPLTTVMPQRESAAAKARAFTAPAGVGLRLPTTASAGPCNNSARPLTNSSGGGSAVLRSKYG
jgi:hypothetical protein